MDGPSDAELVIATLAGEPHAFARLVRRYRDRHARYAARLLGDGDDAEDVLQSAFVRAFRGLARCEDPARFGAWLHRIVVNECRTFATRRAARDRRWVRDPVVLDAIPQPRAPAGDSGLRAAIEAALATLPVEQREAFVLKYVEELEYEEMADVTGAGVSALKMRVKRACERLREQLRGVVDDGADEHRGIRGTRGSAA